MPALKKINNSQDNIPPLQPSYLSTVGLEYSNIDATQVKDLKAKYMKGIEFLEKVNIQEVVSCTNEFKGTSHVLFIEVQFDWLYVEVFDPFELEFGAW